MAVPLGGSSFKLRAIAQGETELRAERQRAGITNAQERGVRVGRRAVLTAQQRTELQAKRQAGASMQALMPDDQIGRATVYHALASGPAARDDGPSA